MRVFSSVVFAIICTLVATASVPRSSIAQTWDIASQHSVSGVTVYDADELLTFAGQLAFNRSGRITAVEVASTITQIYREDGYFLAEAWPGPDGQSIIVDEVSAISTHGTD